MLNTIVFLALVALGLWLFGKSIRSRQPGHFLQCLGLALLAFSFTRGVKIWVAVLGAALCIVGRRMAKAALAARQPAPILEPSEPDPSVQRLIPTPRFEGKASRPSSPGVEFTPSGADSPETSAEQRVHVRVSTLELPAADGGRLELQDPTLELRMIATHLPDDEVGIIVIESAITDSEGQVWCSESAIQPYTLTRPLGSDNGSTEEQAGPHELFRFDRAPAEWHRAFDTATLVKGVATLDDGRDWAVIHLHGQTHYLYYKYQSPVLDVALLDAETILVRASGHYETLHPRDEAKSDARTLPPIVYALPVTTLFWFLDTADEHFVRFEDGWSLPHPTVPLVFYPTEERAEPSRHVTHRAPGA